MISEPNKALLQQKRGIAEEDLTLTIAKELQSKISDAAASVFSMTTSINNVKDNVHVVQMVIINKWFRELLLVAKSNNPQLKMSDVFMCIEDNLPIVDWVKLYSVAVIPFIKNNKILS